MSRSGTLTNHHADGDSMAECNNKTSYAQTWKSMIGRLKVYKEQHGNCQVPADYKDDSNLYTWVRKQRQLKMVDSLSKDRVEQLDKVGFVWQTFQVSPSWDSMIRCLSEYKKENGHCKVPTLYNQNPKLGKWVHVQQSNYEKNRLTTTQIQHLETVGLKFPDQKTSNKSDNAAVVAESPCNLTRNLSASPPTLQFNPTSFKASSFLPIQPPPAQQEEEEEACNKNIATAALSSFLSESIDEKIEMNWLPWEVASTTPTIDEEKPPAFNNNKNDEEEEETFPSSSLLGARKRGHDNKYYDLLELSRRQQHQRRRLD